jgi:hypothetical protein
VGRGDHDSIAIAQMANAAGCFRMTFVGASSVSSHTRPHSNSGTRLPQDYSLWHERGDISPETAAIGISAARNSVFCGRRCSDLLYRGSRNVRLLAVPRPPARLGSAVRSLSPRQIACRGRPEDQIGSGNQIRCVHWPTLQRQFSGQRCDPSHGSEAGALLRLSFSPLLEFRVLLEVAVLFLAAQGGHRRASSRVSSSRDVQRTNFVRPSTRARPSTRSRDATDSGRVKPPKLGMPLAAAPVVCCIGRGALGSILPFWPRVVFDDADTRIMGEAFDAACEELRDTWQSSRARELMAKRIIDAARAGERDVDRLRDAALAALGKLQNRL